MVGYPQQFIFLMQDNPQKIEVFGQGFIHLRFVLHSLFDSPIKLIKRHFIKISEKQNIYFLGEDFLFGKLT